MFIFANFKSRWAGLIYVQLKNKLITKCEHGPSAYNSTLDQVCHEKTVYLSVVQFLVV